MFFKLQRLLFWVKWFLFRPFADKDSLGVLILTRFNLEQTFQQKSKNPAVSGIVDLYKNEDYLEERFRLFEKYYLPSIKSQTDKNFKAVVFFHPETPKIFKERIEKYTSEIPQFMPVFSNDFPLGGGIRSLMMERSKAPWWATIRLDNDDALSLDFVQKVREHFAPIDGYFINFNNGIQYCEKNNIFYNRSFSSGHFLVYLEKIQKNRAITSVYSCIHTHAKHKVQFLGIDSAPMFLEVIHDSNVSNILRSEDVALVENVAKRFSI